ncbi:MAG: hypothetical protein COA44_00365 [Arcobacter sp.]|nr:MAG: hypothetical protein COA44_00365 [Arcobacter sp.]
MTEILANPESINSVSQLIKLSVAPAFLLASVGGLLGVFSGRISRIIERFDKIDALLFNSTDKLKVEKLNKQRSYLEKRADNMNRSIFFCTATGILIAFSIIIIFMSAFFVFDGSTAIATLFIAGMLSLVSGLSLFLKEIFMATRFLKRDIVY